MFIYIVLVAKLVVFTLREYYPGSTQWNYSFSKYVRPILKVKAYILSFELSQGFLGHPRALQRDDARRAAIYRTALTKIILRVWPTVKLVLDTPAQKVCSGYENPFTLVHLLSNPQCTHVSWIDHKNYDRVIIISKHGTGFMSTLIENGVGSGNTREFRRRFDSLKHLSDTVRDIDREHLHEITVSLHNRANVTL